MKDHELEEIYNAAIDGEGKTVFDGLLAVALAEREACAKICEEDFERYSNTINTNGGYWYGKRDWDECARDIRMRSNVI